MFARGHWDTVRQNRHVAWAKRTPPHQHRPSVTTISYLWHVAWAKRTPSHQHRPSANTISYLWSGAQKKRTEKAHRKDKTLVHRKDKTLAHRKDKTSNLERNTIQCHLQYSIFEAHLCSPFLYLTHRGKRKTTRAVKTTPHINQKKMVHHIRARINSALVE